MYCTSITKPTNCTLTHIRGLSDTLGIGLDLNGQAPTFLSKKIKNPILQELKIFEKQFFISVSSKFKLLDLILRYILKRKGKQIRPILVILFSKMFSNGKVSSKTYRAANLVELIHSASLIHDDVVDDSNIRRKFLTINALWKNKISLVDLKKANTIINNNF